MKNRVAIRPSIEMLQPGESRRFRVVGDATMRTAAAVVENVSWSVNAIPGGSPEFGVINADGVYHAPERVPSPREVQICAYAGAASNSHLFATVVVGESPAGYRSIGSWTAAIARSEDPSGVKKFHGIGFDRSGDLLLTDELARCVWRYTKAGVCIGVIRLPQDQSPGGFHQPRVTTVDQAGNIYVSDVIPGGNQIHVFSDEGLYLHGFAAFGSRPGQILRAHGMAFDSRQRLFVTDVDNERVAVFKSTGEFLFSWGTQGTLPGQLNAPHGLIVDPGGDVFVTGYFGPTQKFTPGGDFLYAFGYGDPPDNPRYFHSNFSDRWGNAFLVARYLGKQDEALEQHRGDMVSFLKFNNNGDYITGWSLSTPGHKESWAVVGPDDNVYAISAGETDMAVEIFQQC